MYSHDELKSLHGFLRSTAEGNLKNMLGGGAMTDAHLRLLVKVVRAANEDEWVAHWEAGSYPKVKLTAIEIALKEGAYKIWGDACGKVGLLTTAVSSADQVQKAAKALPKAPAKAA